MCVFFFLLSFFSKGICNWLLKHFFLLLLWLLWNLSLIISTSDLSWCWFQVIIFSHSNWFSCFLELLVILHYIQDILLLCKRLKVLFKSFILAEMFRFGIRSWFTFVGFSNDDGLIFRHFIVIWSAQFIWCHWGSYWSWSLLLLPEEGESFCR